MSNFISNLCLKRSVAAGLMKKSIKLTKCGPTVIALKRSHLVEELKVKSEGCYCCNETTRVWFNTTTRSAPRPQTSAKPAHALDSVHF